ncbi:GNAT family N-acetyltransferase [Reichenbachiella versicolor]|uniref:GNAT family N-acetyltransferase n=1 Tax=Reichenbachiella versicolor TaxID=1821036 RepID=UPI000D6DD62F|nr:N-acetyltransferase [Reichenbachiella versicolor]
MSFEITPLTSNDQVPYHLLELADPDREKIDSYLSTSMIYIAKSSFQVIGVIVISDKGFDSAEIKNLAVKESEQGRGIGKKLIRYALQVCSQKGVVKLEIATGNSSIGQLALYQKEGFEIREIINNYFVDHYHDPIVENGIPCKHKIVLERWV